MEIWDPVSTKKFNPEVKSYTLKREAGGDAPLDMPATVALIGDWRCRFPDATSTGTHFHHNVARMHHTWNVDSKILITCG